jgi:hypothetical protein
MRSLRLRFPSVCLYFHATRQCHSSSLLLLDALAVSVLPIKEAHHSCLWGRPCKADIVLKANIVQGDIGRKGVAQGAQGNCCVGLTLNPKP